MKLKIFLVAMCFLPGVVSAEDRVVSRVSVPRASQAAARAPFMAKNQIVAEPSTISSTVESVKNDEVQISNNSTETKNNVASVANGCRDEYRKCMDEFCLLDESEGYRCACSDNIYQSKEIIQGIQKTQADAEKLYTEGVEREKLGAKARLVFGESNQAQKASKASGLSFAEWINSSDSDNGGDALNADSDIGDGLYSMAANYCATKLTACGDSAEMESTLYSRVIVQDCKNFNNYLTDQKRDADSNKQVAEAAVRKVRLEMLDTTNKYNRGECLLAYKSCIADKGGCGSSFENCLDEGLLSRRANACENVLDQCTAVKDYVLQDWKVESKTILDDAAKYADKNRRATCFAKIQTCLEDGCSTESNSGCLTDVNVAAGVCPIIDECNDIIPGIKNSVNDKLGFLRTQFCQNDIDKCLQDKCGKNFNAPECLGKKTSDIVALCPQTMFPSCKGERQFNIIVQATILQMDYQMLQSCTNYFAEQLGKTCGTDMSCLPNNSKVISLTTIPETEEAMAALRQAVQDDSKTSVNDFFKTFEKDITVSACSDSKKPTGRKSLGDTVFNSAKIVAEISAESRALHQLESKIAELSRAQTLKQAEENCYATYKVETPSESKKKNYSYIKSVSFEPALRNCHVCRLQQVCEKGGESKNTSGLKAAGGMAAAGASAGTMIMPGWGTAIGGVVGAVGGFFAGRSSGGTQEFCQEVESCEDVNM